LIAHYIIRRRIRIPRGPGNVSDARVVVADEPVARRETGPPQSLNFLRELCQRMRRELRQMDILTRYAGDEFVAIMPMASGKMAISISERMRNAVEEQLFSVRTGTMVGLGVSLGVACFPDDGETSEELLTAAARRMQQDKNSRKTVLTVAAAGHSAIDMMT